MSGFIRPELRSLAWRAREALSGGAVLLFGLWWILATTGLMSWIGVPVLLLGAALVALGLQRMRFRTDGAGPGLVEITEGQIAYYGPLVGGAVATDALTEIQLDPRGWPLHWVLTEADGAQLQIPVTATGSEALFDVFSRLPGFRTEAMLRLLDTPGHLPQIVWRRPDPGLGHGLRLVGKRRAEPPRGPLH